MSTSASSTNPASTISETAEIRILSRRRWRKSDYKLAHVLISSRIYWKAANGDESDRPQSLIEFRNANSLRLTRLNQGEWNDVNCEKNVKEVVYDGRVCISVPGSLHGPKRLLSFFLLRDVILEIDTDTCIHYELFNQIRALIVPWKLFPQLVQSFTNFEPITTPSSEAEESDDRATNHDRMLQELSILDDLIAKGTTGIGAGGTLANLATKKQCVEGLQCVADVAGNVADIAKVAGGASALVFYLVKLTAQTVIMFVQAERGRRLLPVQLDLLVVLLRNLLKNIIEIVNPSRVVNVVHEKFVFMTLRKLARTMDMAETQFLRGWVDQLRNFDDVKQVEQNLRELLHDVVTVGNIAENVHLRQEQKHLREVQERHNEELQLVHLRVSKVETVLRVSQVEHNAVTESESEIQPQVVT